MLRSVVTTVDATTWRGKAVPPEVQRLSRVKQVDVFAALLHTAIWTRPPRYQGFLLNDLWAWMRYAPAIAATADLRLREEWTDVDPHQKTILSDEVAVGVLTSVLTSDMNCIDFADTAWALKNVLGSQFKLKKMAKRGPSKAPDYIGRRADGRFVILECKGTQSSRSALAGAMKAGVSQKGNLKPTTARVVASLVGGVYIPQWTGSGPAEIIFRDPEWEEIQAALDSIPREKLELATTQVTLAKLFSLAGHFGISDALGEAPLDALDDVIGPQREAIARLRREHRVVAFGRRPLSDTGPEPLVFEIDIGGVLDRLAKTPTTEALTRIAERSRESQWSVQRVEEKQTVLTTPHGARLSLTWGP